MSGRRRDSKSELAVPMAPSDYFRRQIYSTFWFERAAPKKLIEEIGEDNIMFETDFPHPPASTPTSRSTSPT